LGLAAVLEAGHRIGHPRGGQLPAAGGQEGGELIRVHHSDTFAAAAFREGPYSVHTAVRTLLLAVLLKASLSAAEPFIAASRRVCNSACPSSDSASCSASDFGAPAPFPSLSSSPIATLK